MCQTNFETGFMSFDTCFLDSFRFSYLDDWYYIKSLDTHTLRENAFLISRNRFSTIQRTRSGSDKVFFRDLRASLNNRIPVHAFLENSAHLFILSDSTKFPTCWHPADLVLA